MKKDICGDTIETYKHTFKCTKKSFRKGYHGTSFLTLKYHVVPAKVFLSWHRTKESLEEIETVTSKKEPESQYKDNDSTGDNIKERYHKEEKT
ncbi:MAG: hypothetical protein WC325_11325 [Candidatus Bathyarchaeia archaeon]|jgi:hypothetical protein